jgi:hypothetical protein
MRIEKIKRSESGRTAGLNQQIADLADLAE